MIFFETNVCDKFMKNKYEEIFIENNSLENLVQDYSSFQKYIDEYKKNLKKNVVSFSNLGGDTGLIIPIPRKERDYTTIKDFIDNASISQQKIFWKKVASEIKKILKNNEKIYISTHGLGVSYFHLRLDKYPKYYHTKKFIN